MYPSTHILKLETVKKVCVAEQLGLEVARLAGLGVVRTAFHCSAEGTPYLLIERYDRERTKNGGPLRRLHQEDIAQALGYPPERKYEAHGGPHIGRIAELLRMHSADPVRDIAALRDWQILNYLLGNYDGHAKNLALLYQRRSAVPRLAPFYDMVSLSS